MTALRNGACQDFQNISLSNTLAWRIHKQNATGEACTILLGTLSERDIVHVSTNLQ